MARLAAGLRFSPFSASMYVCFCELFGMRRPLTSIVSRGKSNVADVNTSSSNFVSSFSTSAIYALHS